MQRSCNPFFCLVFTTGLGGVKLYDGLIVAFCTVNLQLLTPPNTPRLLKALNAFVSLVFFIGPKIPSSLRGKRSECWVWCCSEERTWSP